MGIKLDSETFFQKKVLIPIGVIAGIIVIIMIFATFGNKKSPMEDIFKLNSRVTNLSETIEEYSPSLKSSDLRSVSSSLSSTLTAISSSLIETISSDEYKKLSKSATTDITTEETELIDSLKGTLENARLNATLDRTYGREMSYQISQLIQLEQAAIDSTKDDNLKASLENTVNNLNSIHDDFAKF